MVKRKPIPGGVIAAAVTPRRAREHSIDLASTLELIDFLCAGGVDGIELLGPAGEFQHFALEDRARMLDFAVKRSRLPILVNVTHSTLDGAIYLGEEAISAGVAGMLLMPPYCFPYDQAALSEFCLQFAREIGAEIPIYLYNTLQSSNRLCAETSGRLLTTGLFQGIVDASGALLRSGLAAGAISELACAVPELMVRLDRAAHLGDASLAVKLEGRVQELRSWTERLPAAVGVKEALKLRKMKMGELATPLGEQARVDLEAFRSWFSGWLPGVLKECR